MPVTDYQTGTEVLPTAEDLVAAFDGGGGIHVDVYRLDAYLATVIDDEEVYVHQIERAPQYDRPADLALADYMLTDRFGSCDDLGPADADGVVWIEGEAYVRTEPEGAIFACLPGHRRPTDQDVADAIARAKREVLADIGKAVSSRGEVMPETIASFADLHDYVDANCYGGLCDEGPIEWIPSHGTLGETIEADRGREVQDAIDAWLRAGRPAD